MNMQLVQWSVDITMGITFLICFVTGSLQIYSFHETTRPDRPGVTPRTHERYARLVRDSPRLHYVAIHLMINRRWIITTTKKILGANPRKKSV